MQFFWLGIGIAIVAIVVEKGGALGSVFLVIIVLGLLVQAEKKGIFGKPGTQPTVSIGGV